MDAADSGNYDPMNDRVARTSRFGPALALAIGFGGILTLMATAGADSILVLQRLETSNAGLISTYVAQEETIKQIGSSLYQSGSVVRDFLLAASPESAATEAMRLREPRERMKEALEDYSRYVGPAERDLYASLRDEVNSYWEILAPILNWIPAERRTRAGDFLAEEAPHRIRLAAVVDKIDAVNRQVVATSNARSLALSHSFRYRVALVLALGLGLGLAALSISHIVRLQKEARARYAEILRARAELEELSAKLVASQEQERRSISRELHDGVGQSLSALLVDLGNLAAVTPSGNPEVRRHLKTAKQLAEDTLNSVRNMALLLRPSMLDDFGLVPALHWQAREISRRTGLQVDVTADGVADELPDEQRTCIYRVAQEALHNSSRHASARTVWIEVSQQSGRLRLTVRDDGKGFDAETTRGMGLVGMEERVCHLGGQFQVEARMGGGTTISVELPLDSALTEMESRPA